MRLVFKGIGSLKGLILNVVFDVSILVNVLFFGWFVFYEFFMGDYLNYDVLRGLFFMIYDWFNVFLYIIIWY